MSEPIAIIDVILRLNNKETKGDQITMQGGRKGRPLGINLKQPSELVIYSKGR